MQVLRKAFKQPLDPEVVKLITSIHEDKELVLADLQGSLAHCAMLSEQGLITLEQGAAITKGLKALVAIAEHGQFELKEEFEDVHMNVEKQLEAAIGEDALRLHTARSRNDQVALDFRLYVSEQIQLIVQAIKSLQTALIEKAAENPELVMPGYTHLQRAQPVLFSHALLAFHQMLERDNQRFEQALERAMVSPLGAGAQAGTALNINPVLTASVLGMQGTFKNSIDAVMDRDFAADFLYAASLCATHLSQLCETLIIWNTSEFGFVKFNDNVTTSSSLMPQKKNPDPVEIVRGKTGLAIGELVNLLATLKGLPLGYNRDLQETKAPVIRAAKSLAASLKAMRVCVGALQADQERMLKAAADPELMATDLVEYLVLKNVPFRKAHEVVAQAVQFARDSKCAVSDLNLQQLKNFSSEFEADVYAIFDPKKSALAKSSPGGTAHADSIVRNLL